jgi:hypothetical protein
MSVTDYQNKLHDTAEEQSVQPHGGESLKYPRNTVRSESRCALRLRYVDLVVSIEFAVEVCYCFNVFSC